MSALCLLCHLYSLNHLTVTMSQLEAETRKLADVSRKPGTEQQSCFLHSRRDTFTYIFLDHLPKPA